MLVSTAARRMPVTRAGAHGMAHQRLGREGEAVHRVGGDVDELDEHLVGRERHVAEIGPEEERRRKSPEAAGPSGSGCRC